MQKTIDNNPGSNRIIQHSEPTSLITKTKNRVISRIHFQLRNEE